MKLKTIKGLKMIKKKTTKQDRLNDMLFKLFIGEVKVKDLASLYGVCEKTIQNYF